MGSTIKEPSPSEMGTRKSLQKCMVANKNIQKGELFSKDNLIAKRTGGIGISPINYKNIIGIKSHKTYKKNEVISLD